MSENNFDDDIRKKLESIRPEYSEAAWQKLKRSLPIPWYMSFLRDYGSWVFGGLATVAFLGSQYNNQTIRKENKLLNDKISTITSSPETKIITDTIYVRQSDTVFTTRYVTRYVRVADEYVEDEDLTSSNKNQVLAEKTKAKVKEQGSAESKAVLDSKSKTVKNKSKNSETDLADKLTASKDIIDKEAVSDKDLAQTNLAFQPNQQVDKVVAGVSDEKLKAAKVEDTSGKVDEEPKKEQKQVEELIIPENKATLPTDQKKAKKIDLSRINARFGITGDYMGRNFNSLGPAVEVFLGERFALNTGLLITGKKEFEYKLLRDFNMNTGKKFEDRYKPYIPIKPEKIQDIEIETSSIKLPIFFSYYVPVRNNLAFMLSTGTKLDLSVIETVKFKGQNFDGSLDYNKFENQYKPKIFSNLFYGMGMQYQYKRFVGQMNPYFEFPFRQASYLVPPKKFGINASLKFSLKK
ncbi:hypothetical protein [Lacihabitans soyangensis]|uniref:Outer membrane protein beta-barrel domain-containing protein n=1 Tax=Lacihabitans soyangensis TaxID=869394 RepID=A0AAE3H1S3_9BACT|nr:hypothetical protein [Lacihabitans soyangensis]MCP9762461.1 hypothetical protein [Lacihabitans soyangensis]